jgi:hypothetical protein
MLLHHRGDVVTSMHRTSSERILTHIGRMWMLILYIAKEHFALRFLISEMKKQVRAVQHTTLFLAMLVLPCAAKRTLCPFSTVKFYAPEN